MQTSISVDSDLYNKLLQLRLELSRVSGRELKGRKRATWNKFMEQCVWLMECVIYGIPTIKAIRYNPYIYGADCPKCRAKEFPLWRRGQIVWKVKCANCGIEFITLA